MSAAPISVSAGRTLAELAESMVVAWIEQVQAPPMDLMQAVQKYRLLTAAYELAEARGRDTAAVAERCNRLYDSLVAAAAERMAAPQPRNTVAPEKQLRRLKRREERRMTQLDRVTAMLRGGYPTWMDRVNAYLAALEGRVA